MKKITIIILILFMFALITPASAAREIPIVGEQICLHPYCDSEQTFFADEPFYVAHGWLLEGEHAIGNWDFNLYIVGVPVPDGRRFISPAGNDEFGFVWRIYNFRNGLPAGEYTFVGFWFIPCQYGPDPSECTTPNEPVVAYENTVTITFTEP